jgi:CheY-like chemotaxis protein
MPPPASKFILLGEDDLDDQELLKEVFTTIEDSVRLTFVDSGKEALTLLDRLKDDQLPCLIVLDYNMPGLSGADILSELNGKSRYSHIPKMIWSTSGSESFRSRCLELGATDYVIKPTSVKELEEVVRYMLSVCST